jgi:hypothetical protein
MKLILNQKEYKNVMFLQTNIMKINKVDSLSFNKINNI